MDTYDDQRGYEGTYYTTTRPFFATQDVAYGYNNSYYGRSELIINFIKHHYACDFQRPQAEKSEPED